ncbi:mevalonate kinase, partial [Citrobacter sp. AAK_AS5]
LSTIHALVDDGHRAIESGDLESLGRCMDENQRVLAALELSTSNIESACRCARDAGALGAKLTGKGGGGCVIALSKNDP